MKPIILLDLNYTLVANSSENRYTRPLSKEDKTGNLPGMVN